MIHTHTYLGIFDDTYTLTYLGIFDDTYIYLLRYIL